MDLNNFNLNIEVFDRKDNSFLEISFDWENTYESVEYEIFGSKGSLYKGLISSIISNNNFNQIFKIHKDEHLSIKYIIEDQDEKHYVCKFLNDYKCFQNNINVIKKKPEKFTITETKNISISVYDENDNLISYEINTDDEDTIQKDISGENPKQNKDDEEDEDSEQEDGEDEDGEDEDEEDQGQDKKNKDELNNSDNEDSDNEDSDSSEDTEEIIQMSNLQSLYA